jgi:uncharacterized protein YlxW (UPF0749 family)
VNPFVARITPRHEQWIWPVAGMCLVLGFMISMAWVTEHNRVSRYPLLGDTTQKGRVSEAAIDIDAYQQLQNEVGKLREENTKLQNGLAKGNESSKLLNDSLQETKLFAGLTAVEGPGLTVTLRDSSRGGIKVNDQTVYTPDTNIHDTDVLHIVNELFSAGAEAISINDHRIAGPTSIRCVGPTILIDDVKVASPIVVKAIGDPKTLDGALNLNGGALSEIRGTDPNMVQIEEDHYMKMDPFSGRTEFRLAKLPKDLK